MKKTHRLNKWLSMVLALAMLLGAYPTELAGSPFFAAHAEALEAAAETPVQPEGVPEAPAAEAPAAETPAVETPAAEAPAAEAPAEEAPAPEAPATEGKAGDPVTAITIFVGEQAQNTAVIDLNQGATLTLNARVEPATANQSVRWTSSKKKVATVDVNGVVTAKKPGKTTLTAAARDGGKVKAKITVTVLRRAQGLEITGPETVSSGDAITLKAAISPSNATEKSVTWAVSDESVASINQKGVVTAKPVDAPTAITVTASTKDGSGLVAQRGVTVLPGVTGIRLYAFEQPVEGALTIDMAVSKTVPLTAVLSPAGASAGIAWSSSNKKIAVVSADGLVTLKKAGKVKITAALKGNKKIKAICEIQAGVLASAISISGADTVAAGKKITLSASVQPSNVTNKAVEWTVSDAAAASISKKGVLTAKSVDVPTSVTVTARTTDGTNLAATHVISVTPVAGSVQITANGAAAELYEINMNASATLQLASSVAPASAAQAVAWESSEKKIATVDANGLVTAKKAGTVTITARTQENKKIKASVKIKIAALANTISISGADTLTSGDKTTLRASVLPANVTNKSVVWASGNEAVLTVNSKGVATAKAVDQITAAVITATAADGSGIVAEHTMTVIPRTVSATIETAGKTASEALLYAGDTLPLTARFLPADASQLVTWSSNKKEVAKVDASGIVTAVKAGSATITAKAADGGAKAAIKITVRRGEPSFTLDGVGAASEFGEINAPLQWTAQITGGEALTVAYEILKDGAPLSAAPVVTGVSASFTPAEPGEYQARVTVADQTGYSETALGGLVRVYAFEKKSAVAAVTLGGVSSGKFVDFGPDRALPEGVTVTYAIAHQEGAAATLSLGAQTGGDIAIQYTEHALGSAKYYLSYRLTRGGVTLLEGGQRLSVEVVAEADLPSAITVSPAVFVVKAGADITLPLESIAPVGGRLASADFAYALKDASGAAVGTGLTARFAQPGRYALTLTASYAGREWSCPVTFIAGNESGSAFDIALTGPSSLYASTHAVSPYGQASASPALNAGERLDWSLEKIGSTGSAAMSLVLTAASGAETALQVSELSGSGTVTYRLTAKVTDQYYAVKDFTVMLVAEPANAPSAIGYVGGGTATTTISAPFTLLWTDIVPVSGAIPEGAVFGVEVLESAARSPMVTAIPGGVSIDFGAAGQYTLRVTMTLGNLIWQFDLPVNVMAVNPIIHGSDAASTLYNVEGIEPYGGLAGFWIEEGSLPEGEPFTWRVERVSGPDVVELRLSNDSTRTPVLLYTEILASGEATYRVTLSLDRYPGVESSFDIRVTVVDQRPEAMVDQIAYVPEAPVRVEAGTPYTLRRSDFADQDGNPIPDSLRMEYSFPSSLNEYAVKNGDDLTITFPSEGRYWVACYAVIGNLHRGWVIEFVVGAQDGTIALRDVIRAKTLYPSRAGDYIGGIETSDLVLLPGEALHWTVEKIGGSDAIRLWSEEQETWIDLFADVKYAISSDETARFRATAYVNEEYQGSIEFTLTAAASDPVGLPTGISSPARTYDIPLNGKIIISKKDITPIGADFPEGVYYDIDDLPWDDCTVAELDDFWILYFHKAGRYVMRPTAGFESLRWEGSPIVVNVAGGVSPDFDLDVYQRYDTVYLDGQMDDSFFCNINTEGVVLLEGETYEWTLTRIDGGADTPLTVSLGDIEENSVNLFFGDVDHEGSVTYRVTFSAADGLYRKSADITLTAVAQPDATLPTGTHYNQDAATVNVGDTVMFRYDNLILEGVDEGSANFWKEFNFSENVWDHCDVTYEPEGVRVTFNRGGRYVLTGSSGLGNRIFEDCFIPVMVTDANFPALTLGVDQRKTVLFQGGREEDAIAYLWLENFDISDGERVRWTITPLDAGAEAPVEMFLNPYEGGDGASVDYRLLEGTGRVRYRVTAEYADLSYSAELTVDVVEMPANMPSGISVPETRYELAPGEPLLLNRTDIGFASGAAPDGYDVYREYSLWDASSWDSIDTEWPDDDTVEYIFHEEGRYIIGAQIAVGNLMFEQTVEVIVREDQTAPLDPHIDLGIPYTTIYEDGDEGTIGYVEVNALLRDGESDYEWSVQRLDDNADLDLEFYLEDEQATLAHAGFIYHGGFGTATFRITYSALGGLYYGSYDFTMTVAPNPGNLPTGITVPQTRYELTPGETISLDLNDIQFANGEVPEGAEAWRNYSRWNDDERIEEEYEGDLCMYTFHDAGRYLIEARIGIGNHSFEALIEVIVREDETAPLDPNLTYNAFASELYQDQTDEIELGTVHTNVLMTDDDAFDWSLELIEGDRANAPDITFNDWRTDGGSCWLNSPGIAGTYRYRITFSAPGVPYSGAAEFELTVHGTTPEGMPSGISIPQTQYELAPGESITLNRQDIQFAGGTVPEDGLVWRRYSMQQAADWDGFDEDWEEDDLVRYTFREEGQYVLNAEIGIGNYVVRQPITVEVRADA